MKVDEVLKTQFHVWYQFLKKATFASQVIELPKEFIYYLLADNLALHSDQARVKYDKKDSDSDSSSSDEEDNAAWDEAEKQTPSLPVCSLHHLLFLPSAKTAIIIVSGSTIH